MTEVRAVGGQQINMVKDRDGTAGEDGETGTAAGQLTVRTLIRWSAGQPRSPEDSKRHRVNSINMSRRAADENINVFRWSWRIPESKNGDGYSLNRDLMVKWWDETWARLLKEVKTPRVADVMEGFPTSRCTQHANRNRMSPSRIPVNGE